VKDLGEMLDFLITQIEERIDFKEFTNILFEGPVSRVTKTKK